MDKQKRDVMIGAAIFLWGIIVLRIFIEVFELIDAYNTGYDNYVGLDAVTQELEWDVMLELVFMWPLYAIAIGYTIYMIIIFKKKNNT